MSREVASVLLVQVYGCVFCRVESMYDEIDKRRVVWCQ
jgi:hypothetical protein